MSDATSTGGNPNTTNTNPKSEKPKKTGGIRHLIREYGPIALLTYGIVSVISMTCWYIAVSSGLDVPSYIEYLTNLKAQGASKVSAGVEVVEHAVEEGMKEGYHAMEEGIHKMEMVMGEPFKSVERAVGEVSDKVEHAVGVAVHEFTEGFHKVESVVEEGVLSVKTGVSEALEKAVALTGEMINVNVHEAGGGGGGNSNVNGNNGSSLGGGGGGSGVGGTNGSLGASTSTGQESTTSPKDASTPSTTSFYAKHGATIIVVWAAHNIIMPIRVGITAMLTPYVAKRLRAMGFEAWLKGFMRRSSNTAGTGTGTRPGKDFAAAHPKAAEAAKKAGDVGSKAAEAGKKSS
ncbi:hypothetical protein HDU76_004663 [Blyttiomyces sp. JEL0837]|nr:hypothetical protein HDU76_004663 [Blyttiomyces sp. JEL0837]